MTMIVNNSERVLKIAGVEVGPREMAEVNASAKDLKEHLFVRCGWVEVSGKPGRPAKAKESKAEESGTESQEPEGGE
jgi:hypothetical protein